MTNVSLRDKLIIGAINLIGALIVGLLARYGIDLPPIIIQPSPERPAPKNPPPESPPSDPMNAIVRIQRTGAGCSATIIAPRRADGRYWVLSAAHCCDRLGERWVARFRDGRTTGLQVVSINKESDYCWMLTDVDSAVYPCVSIAGSDPQPGERVWHAGYGVDQPGNREDGVVSAGRNRDGQIEYRLSVSSGDSGGGIMLNGRGEVLSPVCCTTAPGKVGRVWGASPVVARAGQAVMADIGEWTPIPIPTREE